MGITTVGVEGLPRGRRGVVVLAGMIVVVLALIFIAVGVDCANWVGWLPSALVTIEDRVIFFAVLAMASYGAWSVHPLLQSTLRDRVALSSRNRREIVGPLATLILVGSAVFVTVPYVVLPWALSPGILAPAAWSGGYSAAWILGSWCAVTTLGLVGVLVGLHVPSKLSLIVAPVVAYLVVTLPHYSLVPYDWAGLSATQYTSFAEGQLSFLTVVLRIGFWSGILGALWALLSRRGWLRTIGVVVAGTTLFLTMFETNDLEYHQETSVAVCDERQIQICTLGPYEYGLPEYADIVEEVWAALPPSLRFDAARTDERISIDNAENVLNLSPLSGFTTPTNVPDRRQTLISASREIFDQTCTDERVAVSQLVISVRWLQTLGIPISEVAQPWEPQDVATYLPPESLEYFTTLQEQLGDFTDEEFREWLDPHAPALSTCSISLDEEL